MTGVLVSMAGAEDNLIRCPTSVVLLSSEDRFSPLIASGAYGAKAALVLVRRRRPTVMEQERRAAVEET
jgi:hypothetical protein